MRLTAAANAAAAILSQPKECNDWREAGSLGLFSTDMSGSTTGELSNMLAILPVDVFL